MSSHRPYAANQPKDGERILTCDHVGSGRKFHWFHFKEPTKFRRPDNSISSSRWIAVCEDCFIKYDDPAEAVRDDIIWSGDEPVIREMRRS